MFKSRILRLIAIALPCLVLAVVLALQALSSVSTRSAPAQSVALLPVNGLAQEQLAFRQFREEVEDGRALQAAARLAKPTVLNGLAWEPLAPKSYAILAMAEGDPQRRFAILDQASRLNRRDISLQGLVLQQHLETNSYREVLDTLDQILRVHPNFYLDFFPVLLNALKVPEAAPEFQDILTGESPWHERFLQYAVRDAEARVNLASIRSGLTIENEAVDRDLIEGLAQQGEVDLAYALYEAMRVPIASGQSVSDLLDWSADLPPFDWALADEGDFRSQPSRDGEQLELFVRSGQGGVIASRIIAAPAAPFEINTDLDSRANIGSGSVRLIVRCGAGEEPVLDQPITSGSNTISVAGLGSDCGQIVLEITARARRGEPTLRAELSRIQIDPR